MESIERVVLLLVAGLVFTPLPGATTEPSVAPQLTSVFPRGGRLGSTLELTIRGKNLAGASRLEFTSPGIQVQILSSEFAQICAKVTIAGSAETGSHEF